MVIAVVVLGGAGWWWKGRDPAVSTATGPATRRGAAVVAVAIERRSLTLRRRYPGDAFSDAVDVSSRIAGHVSSIDVRIGDEVEAGQVMAQIDDTVIRRQIRETKAGLQATRASVASAEVATEAAQRDLERARGLANSGAIAQQELDDLRTSARMRDSEQALSRARQSEASARIAILQEDLQDVEIRAPFAGTIARRDVDPGTFVQPGSPMLRLVADEPLRVRFRVPEYELSGLEIGQSLRLSSRARSEVVPLGEITRWSGEVSATDRTLTVEGVITTPGSLRPGMYVDVVVELGELEGALIVPEEAVIERIDGDGSSHVGVFVVDDSTARWVDAEVRGRDDGFAAIEAELGDDARVLVSGHRELADGATIRLVDAVAAPEEGT